MRRSTYVAVVTFVGITAVAALLSICRHHVQAADKEGGRSDDRKVFRQRSLVGQLRLYPPVPISGPYPTLLYTARAGDVVELQLSYFMAPPFPASLGVRYDPSHFEVIDVVGTENEVVVLTPGQGQTGKTGLGYYSVYLKARRSGRTEVEVPVEFDDGDTEVVPFSFQIGLERKTTKHGHSAKQGEKRVPIKTVPYGPGRGDRGEESEVTEKKTCFYGFFTISDEPHGAFACRDKEGKAIYGWTAAQSREELTLDNVALELIKTARLYGRPGWFYKEKSGGSGAQWFFSYPDNGISYQAYSTDNGKNWVYWFVLRAVKIGE